MPTDLMTMRRLLKFLTGRHNMKGSFEWLEGFKSSMVSAPVSWESSIMGQLRGPHHWVHYTWATHHIPYILVTRYCLAPAMDNFTNYPARGLSSGMAGCLQAICPEECGDYLWPGDLGSAECLRMVGWVGVAAQYQLCSFSAQCWHCTANLTHISGQFGRINTNSSNKHI